MTIKKINRRDFLRFSAMGATTIAVSSALTGCGGGSSANSNLVPPVQADPLDPSGPTVSVDFNHGVASGDPSHSAVVLWTRVSPLETNEATDIPVSWEVSTDAEFNTLITSGETTTNAERDYTIKVDVIDLSAGQGYYYRFNSGDKTSTVGFTKTLPMGALEKVSLAVVSCSNYPAGYFNVYEEVAKRTDIDAVLHLGDYIYEYGPDGYASEDAEALGRVSEPAREIITLEDYRTRYGQYRSDPQLQACHANHVFISIWDDHEIADNSWREGALNHDDTEGPFEDRKYAALQAYFEWTPIRPVSENELSDQIYRNFEFGTLVNLSMLDTRVIGRDEILDFNNYFNTATGEFGIDEFLADLSSPTRSLLGDEQRQWLQGQLTNNTATWQVLGQQVLMGKINLPGAVAIQQMSLEQYAELGALAQLAGRANAGDPTLTPAEIDYLNMNIDQLTPRVIALLQLPPAPYNLDAWDGYAYERELVLGAAAAANRNLVVLAGDTHNAWANNLTDSENNPIGVEFAASSVTSPGLEKILGLTPEVVPATEAGLVNLVPDMQYMNISDRGFMVVTFTPEKTVSEWQFVSDIKSLEYSLLVDRARVIEVPIGQKAISA